MERFIPHYLQDADNVYRTKHFIVKQVLCVYYLVKSCKLLLVYRNTTTLHELTHLSL